MSRDIFFFGFMAFKAVVCKHGPENSTISIPGELVKKASSQVLPQTYRIRHSGVRAQQSVF